MLLTFWIEDILQFGCILNMDLV